MKNSPPPPIGSPIGYGISKNRDNSKRESNSFEYKTINERITHADQTIKILIQRIEKLRQQRAKMSKEITGVICESKRDKNKPLHENHKMKKKHIGSRASSSFSKNNRQAMDFHLPHLGDSNLQADFFDPNVNENSLCKFIHFLRTSNPDQIKNYFNENAISDIILLESKNEFVLKKFHTTIIPFIQAILTVIPCVSPATRKLLFEIFFNSMFRVSTILSSLNDILRINDIPELINSIERHSADIINAKRVHIFLCPDSSGEMFYSNGLSLAVITLNDQNGLISRCIKSSEFQIINDPMSSPYLDIEFEVPLFKSTKNALICPFYFDSKRIIFVATDKKNEQFKPTDYILLYFFTRYIEFAFDKIEKSVIYFTEEEQNKLISGLSTIASVNNPNELISKIATVANSLTNSSLTRIFSIIGDKMHEETKKSKNPLTFHIGNGLISKAAIQEQSLNFIFPRSEEDFSSSSDDIIEPRIWSMMTIPAKYKGSVTMVLALYNRINNTFFSMKDLKLISIFSSSICTFLYRSCYSLSLKEAIANHKKGLRGSYNLAILFLKSVNASGTKNLEKEVRPFFESFEPKINYRLFIYDNEKLLQLPGMNQVSLEPQILDAISSQRIITTKNNDKAIIVIPIKVQDINSMFLYEYSTNFLKAKTEEEEINFLQRTRIIQANIEHGKSKTLKKLQTQFRRNPIGNHKSHFVHAKSFNYNPTVSIDKPKYFDKDNFQILPLSPLNEEKDDEMSMSFLELSDDSFDLENLQEKPLDLTFGNDFEKDLLNLFPFNNMLINILNSFSSSASKIIILHNNIKSLNQYMKTARALHLLGNSLACSLQFSDLLKIMINSFTYLFGNDIYFKIYDPPLINTIVNEPNTFNLERDRMIYASIKILSTLSIERSTALASFADLLACLIESRVLSKSINNEWKINTFFNEELSFDLDVSNLTPSEVVTLAIRLFKLFKITNVINCKDEKLEKWLKIFFNRFDDTDLFFISVYSLNFAYLILKEMNWFDFFNDSELAALALSVFFYIIPYQTHTLFKYENLINSVVNKNTERFNLINLTKILILLGDDSCDLLENAEFNYLNGLAELILNQIPKKHFVTLSVFHVYKSKLSKDNELHKLIIKKFMIHLCEISFYFAPIAAFRNWITYIKESLVTVLMNAKNMAKPFAIEMAETNKSLAFLIERIDENINFMQKMFNIEQDQNSE